MLGSIEDIAIVICWFRAKGPDLRISVWCLYSKQVNSREIRYSEQTACVSLALRATCRVLLWTWELRSEQVRHVAAGFYFQMLCLVIDSSLHAAPKAVLRSFWRVQCVWCSSNTNPFDFHCPSTRLFNFVLLDQQLGHAEDQTNTFRSRCLRWDLCFALLWRQVLVVRSNVECDSRATKTCKTVFCDSMFCWTSRGPWQKRRGPRHVCSIVVASTLWGIFCGRHCVMERQQ